MKTHYSIAWERFIASPEGRLAIERAHFGFTSTHGDDAKYATNIVRAAFDAGWNACRDAYCVNTD